MLLNYNKKVSRIRIANTKAKKTITAFCKGKSIKNFIINITTFLVRLLGFEPRTSWSVAKRSIQLSYRRININYQIKYCN